MKDISDLVYTEDQLKQKTKIVETLKKNNLELQYLESIIKDYNKLYNKYISSRDQSIAADIASRQLSILNSNETSSNTKNMIINLQSELAKTKTNNQKVTNDLAKNLQKIISLTENLDKVQKKAQQLEVENKTLKQDNETKTKRMEELESISKQSATELKTLNQQNSKLIIENRNLKDTLTTLTANNRLLANKIIAMQENEKGKMSEYENLVKDAENKMKAADLYFSQKSKTFQDNNKDDLSQFKMDVEDVKVPKSLKNRLKAHNGGITSICFNSYGNNLVTAGADNFCKMWDSTKVSKLTDFSGFTSAVTEACFDHSEQLLFAGSMDKSAKLWSLKDNKNKCTFTGHIDYVNCISCFHSSMKGITGSSDRTIKEWDFQKEKLVRNLHCVSACHSCLVTLDDSLLISGHLDGTVKIWSSNEKPEKVIELHDDQILHLTLLPNENQFLSVSKDYTIKLFDIRKMETVYTVTDKTVKQYCGSSISVSSDKKYFTVGSHNGYIYVLNLNDGSIKDTIFNKTNSSILCVAWKPFQSQLFVGDSNGYLTVWNNKDK